MQFVICRDLWKAALCVLFSVYPSFGQRANSNIGKNSSQVEEEQPDLVESAVVVVALMAGFILLGLLLYSLGMCCQRCSTREQAAAEEEQGQEQHEIGGGEEMAAVEIIDPDHILASGRQTTVASLCGNESLCVVCLSAKPQAAILPCGHVCLCGPCLATFIPKTCPQCRGKVVKIQVVSTMDREAEATNDNSLQLGTAADRPEPFGSTPATAANDVCCCVICRCFPISRIVTPCGHYCLCNSCAVPDTCPVCCRDVKEAVPVFW